MIVFSEPVLLFLLILEKDFGGGSSLKLQI